MARALLHPLLADCGVEHGFGLRGAPAPGGVVRPTQVHGCAVATVCESPSPPPGAADAVVCALPGVRVGVVTADCVPILLCTRDAGAVAAVHAGWRGLALGVVAAGVRALRRLAAPAGAGGALVAAIGPHVGACCYEVDAPVTDALAASFPGSLAAALSPSRPGHAMLDLGALAREALIRAGLRADAIGRLPDACTCCDAQRFHSYRRDGRGAGRLLHFIAAGCAPRLDTAQGAS